MSKRLVEATRNQLLNKSKNADNYSAKNQSKGKNRYERRLKSRVMNNIVNYNRISMDSLFKQDILTVGIEVQGETNQYTVTVRCRGLLREIQREVKANGGKLEFKNITRALTRVLNSEDVFIRCDCPDAKYRMNFWQWKNGYGTQVEPRPSDITNPNDTKGAGCKHTLLVLSNLEWVMKVASVINNYIKYCQKKLQNNYATYIFPKIYGIPYNRAVQLSIFDTGMLPQDQETLRNIASTNLKDRDNRGRFIKGNSMRFKPKSTKPKEQPETKYMDKLELEDEKELPKKRIKVDIDDTEEVEEK